MLNTLLLLGCTVSNNSTTMITSTREPIITEGNNPSSVTPSDAHANYQESQTRIATPELMPTISPTPVAAHNLVIANTPTVEPVIDVERSKQPVRTCSITPTRFDTRTVTDIYSLFSHIGFLDDQTIVFSGWAQRPLPTPEAVITPTTPTNISSGDAIISNWITFKGAQLKLPDGDITLQTPDFASLLRDPCQSECLIDVISQSPDKKWQLIQVSTGDHSNLGFWVVSQDEMVQLVNFVPTFSTWEWAADSSMLWFVHSLYEYGLQALVIQLDTTPPTLLTDERGENPLFDATRYVSAFNPINKTVLLTASEEATFDTDELLTFDLSESYTQTNSIRVVTGIKGVVWNHATQNYLLVIVREDDLAITNLDGQILVKVPIETFETIFPSLSNPNLTLDLFLPNNGYALSPSGQYLAIGYGQATGIDIFECLESPIP
jgi:hypothetical protein